MLEARAHGFHEDRQLGAGEMGRDAREGSCFLADPRASCKEEEQSNDERIIAGRSKVEVLMLCSNGGGAAAAALLLFCV